MASIFWLNPGSKPQTQKAMEEHQPWNLKCKGTFVLIKGPSPLPVVYAHSVIVSTIIQISIAYARVLQFTTSNVINLICISFSSEFPRECKVWLFSCLSLLLNCLTPTKPEIWCDNSFSLIFRNPSTQRPTLFNPYNTVGTCKFNSLG